MPLPNVKPKPKSPAPGGPPQGGPPMDPMMGMGGPPPMPQMGDGGLGAGMGLPQPPTPNSQLPGMMPGIDPAILQAFGAPPPGPPGLAPMGPGGLPVGGTAPPPGTGAEGSDLLEALMGSVGGDQARTGGMGPEDPNMGLMDLLNLLNLAKMGVGSPQSPRTGPGGPGVPMDGGGMGAMLGL